MCRSARRAGFGQRKCCGGVEEYGGGELGCAPAAGDDDGERGADRSEKKKGSAWAARS